MVARTAAAAAALTFLTALFGQKPDAAYILIWTLSDKRSRWFQDLGEAVRYVESRQDGDVYVGVSLSP